MYVKKATYIHKELWLYNVTFDNDKLELSPSNKSGIFDATAVPTEMQQFNHNVKPDCSCNVFFYKFISAFMNQMKKFLTNEDFYFFLRSNLVGLIKATNYFHEITHTHFCLLLWNAIRCYYDLRFNCPKRFYLKYEYIYARHGMRKRMCNRILNHIMSSNMSLSDCSSWPTFG